MVTWRKEYPKSTTKITDIPTYESDNFTALDSALDLEHFGPASGTATTSAYSGHHRPGVASVVAEGTTTKLGSIPPCAGALAYNTTKGQLQRNSGVGWADIGSSQWSRMRAYASSNSAISANVSGDQVYFQAEEYDTLSEYDPVTSTFSASAA